MFFLINEIANAAAQGFTKYFFYNVSEPMSDWEFLRIEEILSRVNIDLQNVYYLTATENSREVYEDIVARYDLKKKIKIVTLSAMQRASVYFANQIFIPGYKIGPRPKKFLCFNKVLRLHRLILIAHFIKNNLLEGNYVSTYPTPQSFVHIDNVINCLQKIEPELAKVLRDNKKIFPLEIDPYNERRSNPIDFEQSDVEYFENSYYSIVTETLYFTKDVFLDPINFGRPYGNSLAFTEKTFRPIAMKHPFILVGPCYLLKTLKKKGFKTFHPFINESYDEEEDDFRRLNKIVEEVKRLNSFTEQQWLEWQQNIIEIVNYNHDLFFSTTDFQVTKDITL